MNYDEITYLAAQFSELQMFRPSDLRCWSTEGLWCCQGGGDDDDDVALSDTHVFLLNEYLIELNTANFKMLN